MFLKVMGSSSQGNCYLLKSESGSLLIECGIQYKKIQQALNFDLSHIQACLVTHDHL
jgi:phosphoribosyl 1,2-cyclic phosphodiesterase